MKKLLAVLGCSVFLLGSVDLNHASVSELSSLNGIGKVKAERIISYIKENGCFKNINDLSNVKGLSKKTILKNKESLQVSPCSK